MSTNIQWTDETENIIVVKGGGWWCKRCSPGCDHCYSCKINQSDYFGGNHLDYSGEPPELELRQGMIDGWARQRKPRRHFVASMTDVFGEWVPRDWIFAMLDGMAAAPMQTFQVLTKRASVMASQVLAWLVDRRLSRVPENIWLGFSAENQHWFDLRATHALKLRDVCSVLWCSAEPLLGQVIPALCPRDTNGDGNCDRHPDGCPNLDWVVFGGESGNKARRCDVYGMREGVKFCADRGIPAFVKQLGKIPYDITLADPDHNDRLVSEARDRGEYDLKLKHKKGGEINEWPEVFRVRQFPGDSTCVETVAPSEPSAIEKGCDGQPDGKF